MLPLARLLRFLQLQVNLFVSFQQSLLMFLLYQPVPQIDRPTWRVYSGELEVIGYALRKVDIEKDAYKPHTARTFDLVITCSWTVLFTLGYSSLQGLVCLAKH